MNSKGKGNSYERDLCKRLSLWWSNDENDSIFWRTASSGGRATQRAKKGKTTANQGGDVTFIDASGEPLMKFCSIEIKRGYPDFSIQRIMDRELNTKPSLLEQWIAQAEQSQKDSKAQSWMLIVKQDRKRELIILPYLDYMVVTNWAYCKHKHIIVSDAIAGWGEDSDERDSKNIIAMRLEDFLKAALPEAIKTWVKTKPVNSLARENSTLNQF